jgi:hypothetical protein
MYGVGMINLIGFQSRRRSSFDGRLVVLDLRLRSSESDGRLVVLVLRSRSSDSDRRVVVVRLVVVVLRSRSSESDGRLVVVRLVVLVLRSRSSESDGRLVVDRRRSSDLFLSFSRLSFPGLGRRSFDLFFSPLCLPGRSREFFFFSPEFFFMGLRSTRGDRNSCNLAQSDQIKFNVDPNKFKFHLSRLFQTVVFVHGSHF